MNPLKFHGYGVEEDLQEFADDIQKVMKINDQWLQIDDICPAD